MGAEVTILDIDAAHQVPSQSDRGCAPKQSRQSAKGQGLGNEMDWKILVKERKKHHSPPPNQINFDKENLLQHIKNMNDWEKVS